jgi:alkanesulfonate monooxygenase SsuD/methylene tetrahydromethanopterin reductase-like flavin-dependent oxidoreductase (luciferase family)
MGRSGNVCGPPVRRGIIPGVRKEGADVTETSPSPFAPGSVSLRIYLHDGLPAPEIVRHQRAQARRAAEVGFDGVMVAEHHGGFPGYIPNPVQVAGWMLEAMPRGWAAPAPVLLPLRPWALVAEDIAWLNARFPGRIGLGAGAGSLEADFDIVELPKEGHIERYHHALGRIAAALKGRAEGQFGNDQAVLNCRDNPVPIVTASTTPRGVRAAAEHGAGLLFESMTATERLNDLTQRYRDAGGAGPIVLIRRVWVGESAFQRQERQMGVYRSYAGGAAMLHWQRNELIHGAPEAIAEQLAEAAREVGADALNLRVQVPGVTPDEMMGQIEALEPVIGRLKSLYPWKR